MKTWSVFEVETRTGLNAKINVQMRYLFFSYL